MVTLPQSVRTLQKVTKFVACDRAAYRLHCVGIPGESRTIADALSPQVFSLTLAGFLFSAE